MTILATNSITIEFEHKPDCDFLNSFILNNQYNQLFKIAAKCATMLYNDIQSKKVDEVEFEDFLTLVKNKTKLTPVVAEQICQIYNRYADNTIIKSTHISGRGFTAVTQQYDDSPYSGYITNTQIHKFDNTLSDDHFINQDLWFDGFNLYAFNPPCIDDVIEWCVAGMSDIVDNMKQWNINNIGTEYPTLPVVSKQYSEKSYTIVIMTPYEPLKVLPQLLSERYNCIVKHSYECQELDIYGSYSYRNGGKLVHDHEF